MIFSLALPVSVFLYISPSDSLPALINNSKSSLGYPWLLYATEASPKLPCDEHSLEFITTRRFMKIFRTGSSRVVVVERQRNFNFLPIKLQLLVRTWRCRRWWAKFLQSFATSLNTLCLFYIFKYSVSVIWASSIESAEVHFFCIWQRAYVLSA